jgi:predicted ATPase/DNA-binding CsgD family transcriptional regulator
MAISAGEWPGRGHLPFSSFVGRVRELDELSRLIRSSRLVTLIGPGGAGKTRLAHEVARRRLARDPDGSYVADFTDLADARLLVAELGRALGLPAVADERAVEQLVGEIGARRLLLVLDNCEHVVDECARLAGALLASCPGLRLLATSRETLGLPGEVVWAVPRLRPDEAVRLFAERARARRPGLVATGGDRELIERICGRLEGIPLAIELAAARMAVLSPAEILAGLDDRLGFLVAAGRGTPPRHQALASTLAWSYDLLPAEEQRLFRWLSVFAGGFDLAAAEQLGGGSVDLLGRLVDKSMVSLAPLAGPPTRYVMLETLREYGRERLDDSGEAAAAGDEHLRLFLRRAEEAFALRRLAGSPAALRQLDPDLDNIRAALGYAGQHDPHAGLRLVAATREIWLRLGPSEGLRWAGLFLERCPDPDLARAWALVCFSHLGLTTGRFAGATRAAAGAVALGEALDEVGVQAWGAYLLGFAGVLQADPAMARRWLAESIRLHDGSGDRAGLGQAIAQMGATCWLLGDFGQARTLLAQALDLFGQVADDRGRALARMYLGLVEVADGRPDEAGRNLREALRILLPMRDVLLLTSALVGQALRQPDARCVQALRLAAAASGIRERAGAPFPPGFAEPIAGIRQRAVARIGAQEADRHWAAAAMLPAERAVALALAGPGRAGPAGSPGTGPAAPPLSLREAEIAGLVAQGSTNAQIAARLHLSRRTVENHLLHIFTKLGLENRTQVAAWFLALPEPAPPGGAGPD